MIKNREYFRLIKYIFLIMIFVNIYHTFSNNIVIVLCFSFLSIILILNDYYRRFFKKKYPRLGYLSLIISILGAAVLKYFVSGFGANVYMFFSLGEIFYIQGSSMKALYIFHAFLYFLKALLINKIPNSIEGFSIYGVDFLTYVSASCILFLIQTVRKEKDEVIKLNSELTASNTKLEEYSLRVEELTRSKERAKIAEELHDSLGHSLMALTMHLEYGERIFDVNPLKVKEIIIKAKNISKKSVSDLRKAVSTMKEEREIKDLNEAIHELIENFHMLKNISINLKIDDHLETLNPDIKNCIYKTIREGLTNGIKHGKATEFNIDINSNMNIIKLMIKDNGIGCEKVEKSNGLLGIEYRVNALGGSVSFNSYLEEGFYLEVDLPLCEEGIQE